MQTHSWRKVKAAGTASSDSQNKGKFKWKAVPQQLLLRLPHQRQHGAGQELLWGHCPKPAPQLHLCSVPRCELQHSAPGLYVGCPPLPRSSSHCITTCCDHSAEVNACCPGEFSSALTSPPQHCSRNSHQTAASSQVHCWASPCKQHMGLPRACTKGTTQGTGDLDKYRQNCNAHH